MVNLNAIPNVPIKVVFFVHVFVMNLGVGQWCPLSYLFYNALFFLLLFWTIYNKEAEEPVQMAIAMNVTCILLDIVVIYMNYPIFPFDRSLARMAILNLIIRPISTFILYRHYIERVNASGGTVPPMFGFGTSQRQSVHCTEVPPVHKMPPPDNQMPPPYHS